MSRIARVPVNIPDGVDVTIDAAAISAKGPLGLLQVAQNPLVEVSADSGSLTVSTRPTGRRELHRARAMSGTMRQLLFNLVEGVSRGFEKSLTLVGIGYRVRLQGQSLHLSLGFSHPVEYPLPDGIKAQVPNQTTIVLQSADKQQLGQVAAEIRALRPPEPYKGKGVRYTDETVRMKQAKKK